NVTLLNSIYNGVDPFQAHREHMRQMMRSFSEPYGGLVVPSIMDGRNCGFDVSEHPSSSLEMTRNPFSMFDNMMSSRRNRMQEMHKNFENMSTDSNTHSFSSSSVMTYSKVGNEPPKVFQASSSTRRAPGGIKETQQAVKDSETGLEKMSIAHHIQDRGHVVEKKYNKKTGQKEFNQDFNNIDECISINVEGTAIFASQRCNCIKHLEDKMLTANTHSTLC
uniref:Myeloid leukemia factor 1 n=1 Tax=Cyclopterus lumpus TaxID=8103 RepID=A0A8C2X402_CYCLU